MKFFAILLLLQGPTACVELQNVHVEMPIHSGPSPDTNAVAVPVPQLQQPNTPQPPLPTEKPGQPPVNQ
jgi:hypothetical protein